MKPLTASDAVSRRFAIDECADAAFHVITAADEGILTERSLLGEAEVAVSNAMQPFRDLVAALTVTPGRTPEDIRKSYHTEIKELYQKCQQAGQAFREWCQTQTREKRLPKEAVNTAFDEYRAANIVVGSQETLTRDEALAILANQKGK